jgi:hypothetical protein
MRHDGATPGIRSYSEFCMIIALCLCAVLPAQAEEVLYCADTAAAGFKWSQRGEASLTTFQPRRFTIKVFPGNLTTMREGVHFRFFTEKRIVDDSLSGTMEMECAPSIGAALICEADSAVPWAFSRNNTYVRGFLAGPPAGERNDPNIMIAYGTCTKF